MQVNYQGYLTDSHEEPINETKYIEFKLYKTKTATEPFWSETILVSLLKGHYSVLLGQNAENPISSDLFGDECYLGISIDNEEMLPRKFIASSLFAIKADRANVAETVVDNAITTEKIADHAITADKIQTGVIPSETDPTVPPNIKDGISWQEISNIPPAFSDGIDHGITSENDPKIKTNTTNAVPKWNGSALVNSSIHDNGNVGVGTANPRAKLDVNGVIRGEMPYYFHGAFATPTEWMADVIMNGKYERFCQAIGRDYVKAETLQAHYHTGKGNGYFYKGWYYVGRRFCDTDTHVWGPGDTDNPYNVWIYNGNCGCCIDRSDGSSDQWTYERSAIIWCK
jgi:hypothetical protein